MKLTNENNVKNNFLESANELCYHETSIYKSLPAIENWREGIKIFIESDEPPLILVDMDNTLVNWESQFERLMAVHHPQIPIVPPTERKEFKIERNYESIYHNSILHLTSLDEFWLSMDPSSGAIDALKEMLEYGLDVYIVTTPDSKHTARSSYEKILWIEKHLGDHWKSKTIIAQDKTLIKGDILIDDRPAASEGLLRPSWTHALFLQPYNNMKHTCPKLKTWKEWGPFIYNILVQRELTKCKMPQDHILCAPLNEVRRQKNLAGHTKNYEEKTENLITPDNCCRHWHLNSTIRSSINVAKVNLKKDTI